MAHSWQIQTQNDAASVIHLKRARHVPRFIRLSPNHKPVQSCPRSTRGRSELRQVGRLMLNGDSPRISGQPRHLHATSGVLEAVQAEMNLSTHRGPLVLLPFGGAKCDELFEVEFWPGACSIGLSLATCVNGQFIHVILKTACGRRAMAGVCALVFSFSLLMLAVRVAENTIQESLLKLQET